MRDASFSDRLNHLFATTPSLDGRRYTNSEIARRSTDLGFPVSDAYVAQLRAGTKANPSLRHAEGLAAAFGVDIRCFTKDAERVRAKREIEQLRKEAAVDVRAAAFRMLDLSEQSRRCVVNFIRFLRTQDGLPADPAEI